MAGKPCKVRAMIWRENACSMNSHKPKGYAIGKTHHHQKLIQLSLSLSLSSQFLHFHVSLQKMMGKGKKETRVSEQDPREEQQNQDDLNQSSASSSSSSSIESLYEQVLDKEKLRYLTLPQEMVLGVEKTASQQEIKKAYYKLALRLHPDKNPGDEEAKEKFQQLQKVISILGDEEKRALYDQTGCVDDADLAGEVVNNLKEFFRTMYKKVNETDIEEFEANYRGSESEKNDLVDLYKKYKGNMNRLFCSMLCSDPKLDSHRFKDILDEAIAAGEEDFYYEFWFNKYEMVKIVKVLKPTKAYQKWAKQVSETKPPTSPLRRREKSKKNESEDLYAIISQCRNQRKEQFDSLFSSLVTKYGGGESPSEPSEEEFEAAKKKLESRKVFKNRGRSN
ncbi:unnamed protein product [Camellia sinensis]